MTEPAPRLIAADAVSSASLHALGVTLAARWAEQDNDFAIFAQLAEALLGEAQIHRGFSLPRLLGEIADGMTPARANPAMFSDLPLTFYEDARFRVDLLIWVNSSTEIHDHGFAGAFAVLTGESLHSTFSFSPDSEDGARFAAGTLAAEQVDLLTAGDIRRIDVAPTFAHSAFHLSCPTATLVVRTHGAPQGTVQRSYLAPGLAAASVASADIVFQCDALAMLLLCDRDAAVARIRTLVAHAAPELLFTLFRRLDWSQVSRADAAEAHRALVARPFGPTMLRALVEVRRIQALMARRARLESFEERLALGVVAVLGDTEEAIDFLTEAGISDPARVVDTALHDGDQTVASLEQKRRRRR